jgi:hypothetical protein
MGNTWHVWQREELLTGFWWGNLKETAHLEDLGVDVSILLQ